jgi:hypothetical protein
MNVVVQGRFWGSSSFGVLESTRICGTALLLRYFAVARLVGVPTDPTIQHAIAFHELPRLLDRPRRRERIVERDQRDLAAIDAAGCVDLPEIGRLHPAEPAERGERPAVWHGLADPDFGVGDAGAVFLVGRRNG